MTSTPPNHLPPDPRAAACGGPFAPIQDAGAEPSNTRLAAEFALLLGSLAAIWPLILGWPHWLWKVLGAASVLALAVLVAVRLRRGARRDAPVDLGPGGRRPKGTPQGRKLSKPPDGGA
ncbi:MAG: hypothetical protein L6R28_21660 [Planctomycetes bacterium]|nr:hypothetical protein [Planctomycetota bacterium]